MIDTKEVRLAKLRVFIQLLCKLRSFDLVCRTTLHYLHEVKFEVDCQQTNSIFETTNSYTLWLSRNEEVHGREYFARNLAQKNLEFADS